MRLRSRSALSVGAARGGNRRVPRDVVWRLPARGLRVEPGRRVQEPVCPRARVRSRRARPPYGCPTELQASVDRVAPVLAKRVVLVIVDGMRDDVSRSEMSTLVRLRTYGADVTLTAPQPSLSYPNWTTILTGAPQDISGVTTNWFEGRVPVPTLMDVAAAGRTPCRGGRSRGLRDALRHASWCERLATTVAEGRLSDEYARRRRAADRQVERPQLIVRAPARPRRGRARVRRWFQGVP